MVGAHTCVVSAGSAGETQQHCLGGQVDSVAAKGSPQFAGSSATPIRSNEWQGLGPGIPHRGCLGTGPGKNYNNAERSARLC